MLKLKHLDGALRQEQMQERVANRIGPCGHDHAAADQMESAMMQVSKVICHVLTCQRPECKATGACHMAKVRDEVCAPGYGGHDAGPWSASADGRTISSDDFTHDVLLRVSGDFATDEQRKRYADNFAARPERCAVQGLTFELRRSQWRR